MHVLDNTRILEISYGYEDPCRHLRLGRARPRTSVGNLSLACRAWSGRPVGRRHWRSGRSSAVFVDVSSPEPAARRAHHAATRQPPTLLLGRLCGDEWTGRLLDRELLPRERCRMLRTSPGDEADQTHGEGRLAAPCHDRITHDPWTAAPIRRGGLATSARVAGLGIQAPPAIESTPEFASLCPASSAFMTKQL